MGEQEKVSAIYGQMGEIAKKIGHIARGDKNEFHGYNFRSIDAVYNKVGPLLAENGVFCTVDVGHIDREKDGKNWHVVAQITYCFVSALDGSRVVCNMLGEGMDSGDKAINKAYAAAHKYALLQVFAIPTAEQRDGDFESPETPKQAPKQENNPAPKPPAKPKADAPGRVEGKLESIEAGESRNGKPNRKITISGKRITAWDTSDINDLDLAAKYGLNVAINYTRNGNWRNAKGVILIDDLPPGVGEYTEEEPPPIDDSDVPF